MYGDGKLQDVLRLVRDGMLLIRVSKELRVPARTIRRHRDALVATLGKVRLGSSSALLLEVGLVIHDHIQTMEKALYGLTPDVRRLAYDVAVATGTNYPFNQTNKLAGRLAEELSRKASRPEHSSTPRNGLIKGCWFQQTESKQVLWDLQRSAQWP